MFGYNEGAFGAHAEYLSVPENGSIAAVPVGVTFEQVAPGTEGAHYALAFIRHAGTQAGQDVLVYGATGGIGSAAVQLLKSLGASVTAVCAAENLALVKGWGADRQRRDRCPAGGLTERTDGTLRDRCCIASDKRQWLNFKQPRSISGRSG